MHTTDFLSNMKLLIKGYINTKPHRGSNHFCAWKMMVNNSSYVKLCPLPIEKDTSMDDLGLAIFFWVKPPSFTILFTSPSMRHSHAFLDVFSAKRVSGLGHIWVLHWVFRFLLEFWFFSFLHLKKEPILPKNWLSFCVSIILLFATYTW